MVKVKSDLSNTMFGRWLVLNQTDNDYIAPSGKHYASWSCECQCKNKTIRNVIGKDLKSGKSKSCGCRQIEASGENGLKNKKYNTYDLTGDYGIGYTTKGEEFWFDLEDYEKIKDYCWRINNKGYVVTNDTNQDKRITLLLHRIVFDLDDIKIIPDHIGGRNTRNDNRKLNLRLVTYSENAKNHKLRLNNTSGHSGVSWDKKSNKWKVRISINKKQTILGWFVRIEDAVKIRQEAEKKYYNQFSFFKSQKIYKERNGE